jgi:hypothetical protein
MIWVVLLIATMAIVAGCGGGGGDTKETTPPPADKFVLTGTVKDLNTGGAVVGAKVKVGSSQVTTDSQGKFRLEMTSRPIVTTYSVDGTSATPAPGYFSFWAQADAKTQNASCIEFPVAPATGMDLGTVFLINSDNPPPFPPSCPS